MINLLPFSLFGRHVRHSSDGGTGFRKPGHSLALGQAEIHDDRTAFVREHDVAALDVAVNNALLMCSLQSFCCLNDNIKGFVNLEGTLLYLFVERSSFIDSHDNEDLSIKCFINLMNITYVGMIERRRSFRLVNKAFSILFIRSEMRRQKLERDKAVELDVLSFIYYVYRPQLIKQHLRGLA